MLLALLLRMAAAGVGVTPADNNGRVFLFTPDQVQETTMARRVGRLIKDTAPVITAEHPWETSMFFYHSMIHPIDDPSTIWVYYSTETAHVATATSFWDRPHSTAHLYCPPPLLLNSDSDIDDAYAAAARGIGGIGPIVHLPADPHGAGDLNAIVPSSRISQRYTTPCAPRDMPYLVPTLVGS